MEIIEQTNCRPWILGVIIGFLVGCIVHGQMVGGNTPKIMAENARLRDQNNDLSVRLNRAIPAR